jgi:hypothetical protein
MTWWNIEAIYDLKIHDILPIEKILAFAHQIIDNGLNIEDAPGLLLSLQ